MPTPPPPAASFTLPSPALPYPAYPHHLSASHSTRAPMQTPPPNPPAPPSRSKTALGPKPSIGIGIGIGSYVPRAQLPLAPPLLAPARGRECPPTCSPTRGVLPARGKGNPMPEPSSHGSTGTLTGVGMPCPPSPRAPGIRRRRLPSVVLLGVSLRNTAKPRAAGVGEGEVGEMREMGKAARERFALSRSVRPGLTGSAAEGRSSSS